MNKQQLMLEILRLQQLLKDNPSKEINDLLNQRKNELDKLKDK